ncbi:hypothetical protein Tco_0478648 [Tanacetum coccineum]
MENANPPSTNNRPVLPAALRARIDQELHKLHMISAFSDDEAVDTHLVSPFPHSDNDSDDGEVLTELIEYENMGTLRSGVGVDTAYPRHRYAVSSLMDTAYWLSE